MLGGVERRPQTVHQVAVGPVEALLLELLHHHRPLHLQCLRIERQRQHAVALQVQRGVEIGRRQLAVEVGEVGRSPRVVVAGRGGKLAVIIGHVDRATKHQVFKQVRDAGERTPLVAGAHIVEHIHRHHRGGGVVIVHYAEPVTERIRLIINHFTTEAEMMRISSFGRSEPSVATPSIESITAVPSTTWPNTV